MRLDLLIYIWRHNRNQFQILFFHVEVCNIFLISTLRKEDDPTAVFWLLLPDNPLHSLVNAFFCIAIFFYHHFYAIHHLHFIFPHRRTYGQVTKAFQSLPIFNCQIPYTVKVGDANSYGMSVMELEQANPASLAYLELAKEVLANA